MSHLSRRVVAAANKFLSGPHTGLVIVGVRHYDELMIAQYKAMGYGPDNPPNVEQGFVDNDYKFLNRNQAWNVAMYANQVHFQSGTIHGCLHSEDLY